MQTAKYITLSDRNPQLRKTQYFTRKLVIHLTNAIEVIPFDEIMYAEAMNNCTCLHLRTGKRICNAKTLKAYNQILERNGFIRTHKSYLVNLRHIRQIIKSPESKIKLIDDTTIPISRSRKPIIMRLFQQIEPV